MNFKTNLFVSFLCVLLLVSNGSAFAQAQKDPLEISANDTLEWDRNDKAFTARGDAVAVQGDASIEAAVLKAFYRESGDSNTELHTLTADRSVVIRSNRSSAFGDALVYKVDSGKATLKGANLKMVSDDQTVTARDSFEYWVNDGRLIANGAVKVVRPKPGGGKDVIESDKMLAFLEDNDQGKRVLRRLEAKGNVVITTPDEVLTGRDGFYDAKRNIAEVIGDVVITRGQNVLKGARAQIDLNTNISKMFGAATTSSASSGTSGAITQEDDGRVRGVFFPGSASGAPPSEPAPRTILSNERPSYERPSLTPVQQPVLRVVPRDASGNVQGVIPQTVVPSANVVIQEASPPSEEGPTPNPNVPGAGN